MTDADLPALARRGWAALEPLHVLGYFAPEPADAYADLGLHRRLAYFAARSAAMGPVGPGVTTATFFVFAPDLVNRALPAAWGIASPVEVQQARRRGVLAALTRALGRAEVGASQLGEAVELATEATRGLTAAGRPLYAAHAALDRPTEPLLALWHAATLLREHRGDGHVAVLTGAGLDPVEALVVGGLYAANTDFLQRTRGWSAEQWQSAERRLVDRGLLSADLRLSPAGLALREQIEADTDRLAVVGFAQLGAEGTERLTALVGPWRDALLAGGDLPDWLSRRGR